VIKTSETQGQTEELELAAHSKKSSQTRITALAVFALGLNAAAAVFTMSPSEFALPNVSGLVAELLPHEQPSKPIPDAVVAAKQHYRAAGSWNRIETEHGVAAARWIGVGAKQRAAATEWILIAGKHHPASAGFNHARHPAIEPDRRTIRCENDIHPAFDAHRESRLAAKCHDFRDNLVDFERPLSSPGIRRGAQALRPSDQARRRHLGRRGSVHHAVAKPGRLKLGDDGLTREGRDIHDLQDQPKTKTNKPSLSHPSGGFFLPGFP
jgi:hypothetical protein